MAHMRNVRKELKAMKKMFIVHPDGTYTTDCVEPRYADMVVYHTDSGNLKIEAPCNGNSSTEAQRKVVNELAGKWLDSKMSKLGAANGEITVREDKSVDDGVEIRFITASTDGKLSHDEAVAGAGLIGEWVGKTAKKDTAKKATPAAPAAKADGDDGKKTPPPAEPDKKADPAPAVPDKKSDPAPAEPDKKSDPAPVAPDPEPTKSAPAPEKKAGVHWDPNLSVDENIERLWNA